MFFFSRSICVCRPFFKKPGFYLMKVYTLIQCFVQPSRWAEHLKSAPICTHASLGEKKQSKHNYLYYTSACCAYILTCMSFLCVVLYVCVVEKYHPKALFATNVFHLSYSFSLQLRFLEQVIQSVIKTCQNTHQNMPVLLLRLACCF